MADKLIGSLPEATSIAGNDLLVTEQTSIAKKITAQNLLDSLDELWTEHGGIESFELYSTSGLSKTYRMTYADETYTDITITDGTGITNIVTTTSGLTHTITISLNDGTSRVFAVDDGVGISSISSPSTVGLEDTYTINFSDGSTSTFTVTNGASVSSITLNGTTITFTKDDGNMIDLPVPTLRIRYSVTQPDDDNDIITTPSNWMGVAWALDSAVLHYTDYAWFKIKGETGDNAEVSSYTRQYKYDADGTQAPTTGYYSTIAAAQSAVGGAIQGKYLWIATTVTWNNGTPTVIYSASYQGLDGTGLSGVVKSLYMADTGISLSPDSNGQVTISDADIGSIADPATKSDGQVLTWDATDQVWYAGSVSTGTVNSVNSQLPDVGGNVTIYGTNVAMSSTDSTTVKAAIDAKPDDLSDLGVTVSATELNYTDGVTSNIQDQLDAKPDDLADLGITASATELNYTDGVTSNIQDQLDTMAKAVSHTATGAIASFTDGTSNMPVVDLVADIEPIQSGSGDPSPSNIRPISGWTGCNVTRTGINVWDEEWENGYYSRVTGEKAGNSDTKYFRSKNYIPCVPNTSYYFKAPSVHASNNTYYAVLFYGADKSYISAINSGIGNTARTTPQNAQFMTFYIEVGTSGATYQHDISINYPSTDTDYHSGTDNVTVPISWQTEAGTVYGGTIDAATGLLTVDRAMVVMTGADVRLVGSEDALWRIYTDALNDRFAGANVPYSISNKYRYVQAYTSINQINNSYGFSANIGQLFIHDDTFTSLNDIKASLNSSPLEIVYTLATPRTYQLTPQEVKTLLGTNNIWADTGDITVKYIDVDSDLSDYFVEKSTYKSGQLLQDRNLAYVEGGIIASRAYSVNNYFINADGVLCRITASVSSGGTLIKGTNYIVVTSGLANDLYSLLS